MRLTLSIFLLLATLTLASGCASPGHGLVGTWKLIEMNGQPSTDGTIKIVTPTRFAFGKPTGPGQTIWAGGGRIQVTRNVYTEIIEYHSLPEFVGCVADFSYELTGKMWHHKGLLHAPGHDVTIDEVWVRTED